MEQKTKYVTLKHLLIGNQKQIGLQFYPNKLIQTVIKGLPNAKWSKEYNMAYIENKPNNLNLIFTDFKGVAWVNCSHFFPKHVQTKRNEAISVDQYRKRKLDNDYRPCPEEFLRKLELKRYALNTSKTYQTRSIFYVFSQQTTLSQKKDPNKKKLIHSHQPPLI